MRIPTNRMRIAGIRRRRLRYLDEDGEDGEDGEGGVSISFAISDNEDIQSNDGESPGFTEL